jgi:hypothetical protein
VSLLLRRRLPLPLCWQLLPLLAALCLGWYGRGRYDAGDAPAISAHAQQVRADGSVLAARVAAASAAPQQVLPAGAAATMTFQLTTTARRPVYVRSPAWPASAAVSGMVAGGAENNAAGNNVDNDANNHANSHADNHANNHANNGAGNTADTGAAPAVCADYLAHLQCPALTLAGTLVRERDGQPDLVLSAEGAVIASARLTVVAPTALPKHHANALGIAWPLSVPGAGLGILYERDVDVLPLRLSATGFILDGRPALLAGLSYRW